MQLENLNAAPTPSCGPAAAPDVADAFDELPPQPDAHNVTAPIAIASTAARRHCLPRATRDGSDGCLACIACPPWSRWLAVRTVVEGGRAQLGHGRCDVPVTSGERCLPDDDASSRCRRSRTSRHCGRRGIAARGDGG